jgi:hypothetical protein
MLFWKDHANENKCLECRQSRFIKVVTQGGEKVTTEVAHKQLHYFPIRRVPHDYVILTYAFFVPPHVPRDSFRDKQLL